MNLNLQSPLQPSRNFAARFVPPYTQYIIGPRKPEDTPCFADFDFTTFPLNEFVAGHVPENGDVLELFWLTRRVQLLGLRIEVASPAPIMLTPVTNSGIMFVQFPCTEVGETTLVPNGSVLDRNTDLATKAIVIDDPDYIGLRIDMGAEYLGELSLRVQVVVSDTFLWSAPTNSVKKDGFGQ